MKYGQLIKLLKSKGVKIADGTRHLRLHHAGKMTTLLSSVIQLKSIQT